MNQHAATNILLFLICYAMLAAAIWFGPLRTQDDQFKPKEVPTHVQPGE